MADLWASPCAFLTRRPPTRNALLRMVAGVRAARRKTLAPSDKCGNHVEPIGSARANHGRSIELVGPAGERRVPDSWGYGPGRAISSERLVGAPLRCHVVFSSGWC